MSTLRERLRVLRKQLRNELTPASGGRSGAETAPEPERFGDWEEWTGGEGSSARAPEAAPLAGRKYYTYETSDADQTRVENFPLPAVGLDGAGDPTSNDPALDPNVLTQADDRLVTKLRDRDRLREMIVMREILDRPVALRPRRVGHPR